MQPYPNLRSMIRPTDLDAVVIGKKFMTIINRVLQFTDTIFYRRVVKVPTYRYSRYIWRWTLTFPFTVSDRSRIVYYTCLSRLMRIDIIIFIIHYSFYIRLKLPDCWLNVIKPACSINPYNIIWNKLWRRVQNII